MNTFLSSAVAIYPVAIAAGAIVYGEGEEEL